MQRFVARPVPHAEEITEEIDEAENEGDCVRLRNWKRLMEYFQEMFVRLFQWKTQSTCTNE